MKRRRPFLNLVAALVFLIPACSDKGTPPIDFSPRTLWESFGIHNYTIQQQRACFCPYGGRIVQIMVRADTIFTITTLDTTSVSGAGYLTINQLFNYIEMARQSSTAHVDVRYNEIYGYPERIFVDWLPNAVDDEIAYETSDFLPVR